MADHTYLRLEREFAYLAVLLDAWSRKVVGYLGGHLLDARLEEVYLHDYATVQDAIDRLPHFLEEIYHRKRLHSSLGYRLPEEYEALHAQTAASVNPDRRARPPSGGRSTPESATFFGRR